MKIPISTRLLTCSSYVHPGDRVADIGCDHGYLGIYLLVNGIASQIIAADVNEQPLQCAVINAAKYGVQDRMSFYLSDGVQKVPHDFDCMVCAGMGADTMISILGSAPWLKDGRRLVLQCQSKRPELRRWLQQEGYSILRETLAKDGKFIYTVMEVRYSPAPEPSLWEYYITPALLASASPLLPEFLARVIAGLEKAAIGMAHSDSPTEPNLPIVLEKLRETERTIKHGHS